ncbi:hypothetical protein CMV24_27940 [Pseudomonas plecoglossicida]|uniref:Uncharacterized protein n=1 Tax=Pseudomonas plecoglossicida TaxID=70775 RepID=A0A2A3LX33_PSEDL|nr:hypothetical protein CMV24_27940 [Pseudomonas plecoglossicida]
MVDSPLDIEEGDMEVQNGWYEALPEQCPPGEAFSPNEFVCYRLCESNTVTDRDFLSHRHLFPHKTFNVPECRARSISVFRDKNDLSGILKLPVHRNKTVVQLKLNACDGVAMKTGKVNDSHYSWWRSSGFDMNRAAEVLP